MTVSNIQLASVLTDPFGKTATSIMSYILSSEVFDDEACKKLILRGAKKKTDLILESIKDCSIQSDQKFKMLKAKDHMDYLDKIITQTEIELFVRMQPREALVKHITQLPGISTLSAALILAEKGVDMSVFESSKHLTSWAGVSPANNESAGKRNLSAFLKPVNS